MPKLTSQEFEALISDTRNALAEEGWPIGAEASIPYGHSIRLNSGGVINLYNGKKGPKAIIAGKLLDHEQTSLQATLSKLIETPMPEASGHLNAPSKGGSLMGWTAPWIGSDEAGKGDFFGPLVVCACVIRPDQVKEAMANGVQDSKKLTPKQIFESADWLEANTLSRSIVLMPKDYNTRYLDFGNLNKMLGAMHAKLILALHQEAGVNFALSDKFGPDHHIVNHFKAANAELTFRSVTKGERDTAVAGASIIARAKFVEAVKELSSEATITLPLGASAKVKACAKKMLELFGKDELAKYVKMHFKTAAQIGAREFTAKELGQF